MSAVAAATVAVGVGTSMAQASAASDANKATRREIERANILATQNLNDAKMQGRNDIAPYANTGLSALQQLAYGMGLDVPTQKFTAADAPRTLSGNSGDPLWDRLVNEAQAPHIAQYGVPVSMLNRDQDANNFYNIIATKYADAKNAELEAKGAFVGQGDRGAYLNYGLDQYKKDVGYTPMVNSLEELQATPGYQFQLEQGLQGVNRSAAARGGLLSGANLKAINDYAQGQAATGYQAAWERAQNAYNNAFTRNQTNIGNLKSLAGMGQTSATNQADISMNTGRSLAGLATDYGSNMGSLAQQQGQINSNMWGGIGNAVTSGIGRLSSGFGSAGQSPTSYFGQNSAVNLPSAGGLGNAGNNWAPITEYQSFGGRRGF